MRPPLIIPRKADVSSIKEKVKYVKLLGKRITRPDEEGNLVKAVNETAQKKQHTEEDEGAEVMPRKALPIADFNTSSDSEEEV